MTFYLFFPPFSFGDNTREIPVGPSKGPSSAPLLPYPSLSAAAVECDAKRTERREARAPPPLSLSLHSMGRSLSLLVLLPTGRPSSTSASVGLAWGIRECFSQGGGRGKRKQGGKRPCLKNYYSAFEVGGS